MLYSEIPGLVIRAAVSLTVFFFLGKLLLFALEYWRVFNHFNSGASGFPRGPDADEIWTIVKRGDVHRVFVEWVNDRFGPVFWYRFFGGHTVAITDPWLIKEVLSRPEDFDKPLIIYGPINKMVSPHGRSSNLLTSPTNDHWRLIRKGIMPAFSTGNLKKGFHHIQKICMQLVERLQEVDPEAVLDMENVLARQTMDVIGKVGFGRDMGATQTLRSQGEPAGKALEVSLACTHEVEELFKNHFRHFKIWRKAVRDGRRAFRGMHEVMGELLRDTLARESELEPHTLAAHLLGIKDPATGARLPFDVLLPEVTILFFAGYDTTGHSMSWTLYLLSQHPEVEAKVAAELAQHGLLASPGNPAPRAVEWNDLGKLTYLNAVIKESTRLFSVGANVPLKYALRDVKLGGGKYILPKGTVVVMPVQTLHCSKYNWEQPYDFIPERWLEENADLAQHIGDSQPETSWKAPDTDSERGGRPEPGSAEQQGQEGWDAGMRWEEGSKQVKRYLPFSEGARSCAGMSLAKVNLAACLASLLSHFSFRLADEMGGPEGVRKSEKMALTLSCMGGMKMNCISRSRPTIVHS
eukprot:jgi/Botrbrau1/3406/Bobra.0337s0042.1